MDAFFSFTKRARTGEQISAEELRVVLASNVGEARAGALAACAAARGTPGASSILASFGHPHEKQDAARTFFERTASGATDWSAFARDVVNGTLSDFELGYWLMRVMLSGLPERDIYALTEAMAKSASTFDYRPVFSDHKFLRRYPTGALSEKVALMMPAVLSAMRTQLQIKLCSPYIVARVLGHTGGTRDKLSIIPGFTMPPPGEPTIAILRDLGVCYTVTQGSFNPADDRLYSLRSITDTIESLPLIVSSIASKMLACPVDLMQIDVRHGSGAFFDSPEVARDAGAAISRACTTGTMTCFATVTDAGFPTGSSVGSAAEVAEAVVALGGGRECRLFDERGVDVQRAILADFTSRLIAELFGLDQRKLYGWVQEEILSGRLGSAFCKVLVGHGVAEETAEAIWSDPNLLFGNSKFQPIKASRSGRLLAVDQREIGRSINATGASASLILNVRPGDRVEQGQSVALLAFTNDAGMPAIGPEHFLLV